MLAASLRDVFPGERPVFLIGVLADKDYRHMLDCVVSLSSAFVCVTPPNPRALSAHDLAQAIREAAGPENPAPIEEASDFPDAVCRARELAGAHGLICAFGSLYSVGDVKAAFAEAGE